MTVDVASRLFDEVDRRMTQQGYRADALATRSGLMVAAIAVAASLLAGRGPEAKGSGWFVTALVLLGASALAGLVVLCMSRLGFGPEATQLIVWAASPQADRPDRELLAAKIVTIEANQAQLARVEVVFYIQALTAGLATSVALYAVARFG